jgi:hypothetical protein
MEINFTQLIVSGIVSGITAGITAIFTTIAGFVVMRYLPHIWIKAENAIKNGVKNTTENVRIDPISEADHARK